MRLALALVLALAASGCTLDVCATWAIDPHLFNPSAPSVPAGTPRCTRTRVP